ncbi:M20/M25/M40 family metallo-hydrolase [Cellulomonas endometrii]|uniref:M20/M25/M40 family metallo-hydrolase n=1 Tax=Cellulomonas endometrii TaxID=3036301 RepID=UPI0024ACF9FF|nr:M20/M25/M40 family metallo-hydrolase [Cellulomonas endometrii]
MQQRRSHGSGHRRAHGWSTAITTHSPEDVDRIHAYAAEHLDELVRQLADWVRIPGVAGVAGNQMTLQRSANWLASVLRQTGFPRVELWEVEGGAPAVYAEWLAAPGAPTVLVYSHHDVRSVKPENWGQVDPFEPAVRDGRLYGRGTSDAKGQVLCHVWGLRAHLAATGRSAPAVNVKLLVEGEEEALSEHLAQLLEDHPEATEADVVVLSDTVMWRADAPAVCVGLRGSLNASLEVVGPGRDVHSGAVSGPAPNPVVPLAQLVADLFDEDGRVTLPGFYDDVLPVSDEERAAIAALPYTDEDWLERSETHAIVGERGWSTLERLWLRPAVEVLSVVAGDVEAPTRGAVPSVAHLDLSIRTVPGQTIPRVADQLRSWVKERMPDHVDWELTIPMEPTQEPYRTPDDLPALQVLRDAMADGWRVESVGQMRNAGGSPASLLHDATDAPVLFFGTGLPEDHWHDSDESVLIDMLRMGTATLGSFWGRLAASAG